MEYRRAQGYREGGYLHVHFRIQNTGILGRARQTLTTKQQNEDRETFLPFQILFMTMSLSFINRNDCAW